MRKKKETFLLDKSFLFFLRIKDKKTGGAAQKSHNIITWGNEFAGSGRACRKSSCKFQAE